MTAFFLIWYNEKNCVKKEVSCPVRWLSPFQKKLHESVTSVLPITAIVFLLSVTIAPLEPGAMVLFLFGAVLLVIGMGLFTMGVDMSMIPMGEGVGTVLSRRKGLLIPILLYFLLGVLSTAAEPDLTVLAEQVQGIPNRVLIFTVAGGVGLFLVLATLRVRWGVPLRRLLLVSYFLVFALTPLVPSSFLAVSFDAGGVTTGPITVPFIMALGLGAASQRSDKNAASDSFGLIALCSIGPILSVLLLSVLFHPSQSAQSLSAIPDVSDTAAAAAYFLHAFPDYLREVLIALVPIAALFALFQLITHRFHHSEMLRICAGLSYAYIGLTLFLCGVNIGFMPAGQLIGSRVASSPHPVFLIPIGMLIGFFIVKAEPAVAVLTKQVEEISNGAISHRAMGAALSIGVCVSVGLAMVRVLTGINIYFLLIPGYAISLGLSFLVPSMFTGVAFDSGGVASGPMTATFLLPFAMGACGALGGNIMSDAFGIVAMVAMTPLVTIQVMGLSSQVQHKLAVRRLRTRLERVEDTVAYFDV